MLVGDDIYLQGVENVDLRRKPLRMLDIRRMEGSSTKVHLRLSTDNENNMLSVRLAGEIDLVRCVAIL
jgi:hypothetical protein